MGVGGIRQVLGVVIVAGMAFGWVPANSMAGANTIGFDAGAIDAPEIEALGDGLTVESNPIGIDVQRAYDRLQDLYGRELPAVEVRIDQSDGVLLDETHPDRFFGLLADPAVRIERNVSGGANEGLASVSYRPGTPPELVERVVVHEIAHAVEPPSLHEDMESAAGDYADTTDSNYARLAVDEGAAVFVTDVYAAQYLDAFPQSTRLAYEWPTMTDATRLLWAPYRYGADHVRARAASPANLSAVYADPPVTTEGVLHPEKRGDERPPLAVESAEVGDWDRRTNDTKGELYLRVLLASELAPDRAASAAAGWGTDRLLTYDGPENDSFAWVLRWDSQRDANEFEAAMADYLDAMATRQGEDGTWSDGEAAFRLDCASGETCYLLAGDPGFVDSVRVTGNDSGIEVSGRVR